MSKQRKILALLLCAALVFSLFGCGKTPAPDQTEPPATQAPTEPPYAELYTQAAEPLRSAQDLEIELTTNKEITVGTETFKLLSRQDLILSGIGTDGFAAGLTEELEINGTYDKFKEYYADGVLYTTVYDEYHYQGAQTDEEFTARFAPAVLLDETLYGEITAEESDKGTVLTFSAPTAAESWALPEGAEFVTADGTATIASDGSLTKTTYTMEYTQGAMAVSMTVKAEAGIPVTVELSAPPEPAVYQEITSIEAPRLFDTAVMYLYGTKTASSTITETIISQAAGYTHTAQTQLSYTGAGANHAADIDYTVTAVDNTAATSVYTQNEHFENGVYTISADGGAAEENTEVSAALMQEHAQSYMGENILALDYISNATAEDIGGLVYLELGLTGEYGDVLNNYVCGTLFSDGDFLNNLASAYETTVCDYYMAVDPTTGFPLSLGIQYSGTHTIDGSPYILALQTNQTFRIADDAAYETITGKALPEGEPETPASPLFYRVTGADGQQMYLFGTIHVGDERTAYLPDEIYTALNEADALAVEMDLIAFEEAMTTDMALATQIAQAYMNEGNAATKDMLDEAVYNKAVKLLKASGNYNASAEYMKPNIWSQSIDNFYLTLGGLSTDRGVDMRLLKLAKEQGLDILEVESGMAQIEMLTGFSTDLQLLMLKESLETGAAEYCAEAKELYEMWCAGDETILREFLAEADSDLTEDEMALYQEYIDSMIIQRNTAMLDVATGYLESGETVFVAVGLAHLLQENGLVDTLRDAGYTVEPVAYN